jgi:quercetin dioxygenase-like cupin family protein
MKSLRLCTDGTGGAKLESLALPFLFFGPTATDADRARMPQPGGAVGYQSVRLLGPIAGDNEGDDRTRRLLLIVAGGLRVSAGDMSATLRPGDVLFVDDPDSAGHELAIEVECRIVRIDVGDDWTPAGVVPPALDRPRREGGPLLKHMYVADEQAHLRDAAVLFEDVAPRPVARAMFMCLSPDQFGDWHTEEATSLVVVLSGGFELEVGGGGGAAEVFRAGDVCLVQDHHGQGHISRTHGETRFVAVAVPEEHVWQIP